MYMSVTALQALVHVLKPFLRQSPAPEEEAVPYIIPYRHLRSLSKRSKRMAQCH